MINVNISQDKQVIKSYTWLHVDTFLDYCCLKCTTFKSTNIQDD